MPNSSAPVHTESNSKQIVYKDIPSYILFDLKLSKKFFFISKIHSFIFNLVVYFGNYFEAVCHNAPCPCLSNM